MTSGANILKEAIFDLMNKILLSYRIVYDHSISILLRNRVHCHLISCSLTVGVIQLVWREVVSQPKL